MVYLILAEGFEEIEALTTVDLLRRADIKIATVSLAGELVCGAHGITVRADKRFDEISLSQLSMLILPGGVGHKLIDSDKRVDALIKAVTKAEKPIAAICAAPKILAKRGYLEGRRVTCFPSVKADMCGALLTDAPAERDGSFITGRAAGTAVQFALLIIAHFKGSAAAEKIRAEICFE